MNQSSQRFLVVLLGLWLTAGALAGAPTTTRATRAKSADQFARTKERIDALLKRRLHPEPLPANPANPFQIPAGQAIRDAASDTPGDQATTPPDGPAHPDLPPLGSDGETLARLVATLKLSGIVRLSGQVHLIINQAPYKEGDRVPLYHKSVVTYLQVIRITADELTLGLKEAEQTIKFKF